ncbi:alpha/beta hydrolase [Microvirga sp. Mcv34]|uniref:alpha/beta hydrolase n=1 Tax=Microvirga sp. Mcv34 TaxID=2926016 RepID=UPI0021CA266D|nr:esterase family protein [Microvirga sp. Mcv34]
MRAVSGLVAALAALTAGWTAYAGTVISQKVQSATLNREWVYNVYLPDGYETGKLRYPMMYLLHGNGADQNEWVVSGNMQQTVDQLIKDGQMPPAVIVMPSATTTWYVDRKEMMETAFLKDLFPEIEAKFRVMKERTGRVIGGESMGGYGSLRFVLKYPEMFAAAALISPAIYNPEPPETSSARRVGVFGSDKFDPDIWKSLNYPALLDGFFAKNTTVPLYVGSGDDDDFMIEGQAATFYELWRQKKQPGELRIYNGPHSFEAFNAQFPEAVRYIFRYVRRPEAVSPQVQ